MEREQKKLLAIIFAGVVLASAAAAGAAYYTQNKVEKSEIAPKKMGAKAPIAKSAQAQQVASAQPVQQAPRCNDHNIVGTVLGGVGGGLVGSQIGSGSGNTAAIIGGTVGGAYLGNQYIPTDGVACR